MQEIHRHRRVLEQLEQQSGSFLLGHAIVLLQQRGLTVRLCHPGGVLHRERSGNPHILSGFHRLIFIDERRRHP